MKRGSGIYITKRARRGHAPKCATGARTITRENLSTLSFVLIYTVLFYLFLFLSTGWELQFPRADLFQYILCGPVSRGRTGLRLDSKMQWWLSELKTGYEQRSRTGVRLKG